MFAEVFWNLLASEWPAWRYTTYGHLLRLRHQRLARELLLYRGPNRFALLPSRTRRRYLPLQTTATNRPLSDGCKGWKHGSRSGPVSHGRGRLTGGPRDPKRPSRNDQRRWSLRPTTCGRTAPSRLSLVELEANVTWRSFAKLTTIRSASATMPPAGRSHTPREFHMTNDSKLFPPLEKWEAKGYKPDVFGRWIGPDEEVALPLYRRSMIHQFDFSIKAG